VKEKLEAVWVGSNMLILNGCRKRLKERLNFDWLVKKKGDEILMSLRGMKHGLKEKERELLMD